MRILIISNNEICYNPRLLKAAEYLIENKCEVDIFNPIIGSAPFNIYYDIKTSLNCNFIENDISKKKWDSYFRWLMISLLHKLFVLFWDNFKLDFSFPYYFNKGLLLNKIILEKKYDFVLINLVDNLPYAIKIKNKTGAKIIYDSQEYFVGQYQKYGKQKLDWVVQAEANNMKDVDILITTTNVMKERLRNDYSLKIPIIRVRNTPSKKMQLNNDSTIDVNTPISLVWHGMTIYIENTRGVHILIEAVALCKTNVLLTLQGSITNQQNKLLNQMLKRLGIKNKVKIVNAVNPYSIVKSIQKHDIGLIGEMPQEDNQRLTSSNKLFDYINAGLAVIASDLPGLNETVVELNTGISYHSGDIKDLSKKIDFLSNNINELKKLKEHNLRLASSELYWEYEFDDVWNTMLILN